MKTLEDIGSRKEQRERVLAALRNGWREADELYRITPHWRARMKEIELALGHQIVQLFGCYRLTAKQRSGVCRPTSPPYSGHGTRAEATEPLLQRLESYLASCSGRKEKVATFDRAKSRAGRGAQPSRMRVPKCIRVPDRRLLIVPKAALRCGISKR
jgi:hypothetical protein